MHTPADPDSLTAALEAELGPLDDLDPDTAAEIAA